MQERIMSDQIVRLKELHSMSDEPVVEEQPGKKASVAPDPAIYAELVEMRGEGRYFGGDESLGPICRNCHGRGHIAAKCKVVVCDNCGERNSHYTKQCPKSQRCTNCGKIGHLRVACTERSKFIFCSRCESRSHTEETCPTIWRSYVRPRSSDKKPELVYPAISCYNCAADSHYGDECPLPRQFVLRYRERTAFSGDSLDSRFRGRYFDELARFKRTARSHPQPEPPQPKRKGREEESEPSRRNSKKRKVSEKDPDLESLERRFGLKNNENVPAGAKKRKFDIKGSAKRVVGAVKSKAPWRKK